MKLLLWRWCSLSSSRIKCGRNWVCKTSPRNIIRKRPKRFLNTRQSLKPRKEKLSAKVAKKKAKTLRMKKGFNNWKAKLEEMKSECVRLREERKLAIEENEDLQYTFDYVLFALLLGGDGGR